MVNKTFMDKVMNRNIIFTLVISFACVSFSHAQDESVSSRYEQFLSEKDRTIGLKTSKTIKSDIAVLTDNGPVILNNITLDIRNNMAFREGDIFVGSINERGKLIQMPL